MRSWSQPDARLAAPGKGSGPCPVSGRGIEVLTARNDVSVKAKRGVGERRTFRAVRVVVAADKPRRSRRCGNCDRVLFYRCERRDRIVRSQYSWAGRGNQQDPVNVFAVSDHDSLSVTELGQFGVQEFGPDVQCGPVRIGQLRVADLFAAVP